MAIVTIMYPNVEGSRFDDQYYREHHVGRIRVMWKDQLDGIELLRGKSALRGGELPYHYIAILRFKSLEAVQQAFGMPEAAELSPDVVNYTDVVPVMQICETAD